MKYKNALVTGGAGFIGSHLVEELLKNKVRVLVIDNLLTGKKTNLDGLENVDVIYDDLGSHESIKEIEKFKINEIPENLVEEEVKILSQGMSEEDVKKSRKNFEDVAKKRIKVGLILNEFGEQNQIKVSEQELQAEVQKQIRMMPGQEKMVMDFYQKNQSALASLRGTVYEEKILNLVKQKAKSNKKEVSKEEAEKILKQSQNQDEGTKQASKKKVETKKKEVKKTTPKTKSPAKKTKKVSKK